MKIFNKNRIAEDIEKTGYEYLCDSCRYCSVACDAYCTILRVPRHNKKWKCKHHVSGYVDVCPDKIENPKEWRLK